MSLRGLLPRVLVEELRHSPGLVADHDVRRHDRPGEAAVADREEGVVPAHVAGVEVRAVGALGALDLALGLRAPGARRVERVTAAATLPEELGALAERVVLRDLDLL